MRNRPHIVVARPPNSPPHHGCTGEIFFARTCAIDAQSPTRFDRAPAVRRRTPNRGTRPIRPRTMDVRAKYFSPVRAPLMRHRPRVVIARPPHAAAPRMYGRKIFRPYVRQRCPVTQPSNIAAPQIVAPAQCNHAPHVYGRNIFRPSVRHQSTITQPSNIATP